MDTTRTLLTDHAEAGAQAPAAAVLLDPARLPALAAATARLHRLAVDERLSALLAHTLGVSAFGVGTHDFVAPERAAVVRVRWGMETAAVHIDVGQHAGLASVVASDEPVNERLRHAVCAILLDPLRRALQALGFDGVEIVSLERAARAPLNAPCCALSLRVGDSRFDAVIEHIDGGWLDALETLVARQCTPFATHVSEIAVPGRLRIGEKTMSVTTLDSLRAGDVILRAVPEATRALFASERSSAPMQVVWGRYGTRQLRAVADVTHHLMTLSEDPTMSHETQFNAPLTDSIDTPVDISQLDLPLKLEIDTVSMPVAQLSALRAGYVLELPTALPDARVRLVTYGQTIGFGELVSVGDHLGVRLVQLSRGHGSV
ncbi:YscQ/HrcQ family type III secretion apparatus protein [Burkholderia anthina]|uniref:type III secretion system cytoplasmic ring protein SctQ n=1 Tax=Burkholderia anthina TaxID=179879 RepID=UPI000F5F4046|nr:type III secretion system cytoplasmic ring protein SctQ [Burkholderia anthina]RQX84819.1 YscQ/HrcQ family type III secretion apparatus protein [Burkholderia anthina]